MSRTRSKRSSRRRDDEGLVAAYVVLTSAALASVLGLALDCGTVLNARQSAFVEAEQAARAGASALTATGLRSGGIEIASQIAVSAAEAYMVAAGHPGTAVVRGNQVIAQVSAFRIPTPLLRIVGIGSIAVSARAAAIALAG